MDEIPLAMPHGDIGQVFDDVFCVTGTSRPWYRGRQWQFSRNMLIVREGPRLVLVNTVRLDKAGLAALDALGRVEAVVRLGAFHGFDDRFYLERYGASLWALPGMRHEHAHPSDHELRPGGTMPLEGCDLFPFDSAAEPEGLLHLAREGGILVCCDSLQNWTGPDQFFDEHSAREMGEAGFFRSANIGPGWLEVCTPQLADFERLLTLTFRHLLSAHGKPLLNTAHAAVAATVARVFTA